eukprot:8789722-Karenia_brevis.AAC.1
MGKVLHPGNGGRISMLLLHNISKEHSGGNSILLLHSISMDAHIHSQHGWWKSLDVVVMHST